MEARLRLLLLLIIWKGVDCQDCNAHLRKCLTTLRSLVQEEFNKVRTTEEELDEYCAAVQKDSFCFLGLGACRENYPQLTNLSETLYVHLNQVCNTASGRRTVYLRMIPCFNNNEKVFDQCATHLETEKEDLSIGLCSEMKSMLCLAETSRRLCGEDGERFGKALESGLLETHAGACSAATSVTMGYCSILSATLAFVLNKHKMVSI